MPENGDLAHRARAQRDRLAARLGGVASDVQNRLDELLAIAEHLRKAGIVVAMDFQAEFRLHQAAHALQHFMDAYGLDARLSVRGKQAIQQALEAIRLLDDHLRVFTKTHAKIRAFELALQELRRSAQAAQGITDLVSQVADELAVRILLGDDALLARLAKLLLDRPQLGEQAQYVRVRAFSVDACDGARQGHGISPGAAVGDVLRRVIPVGDAGFFERAPELAALREQAQERMA